MKSIPLSLVVAAMLLFLACDKKNGSGTYENCCGASAIADTVHLHATWTDINGPFDTMFVGGIFIPNIFTPSDPVAEENGIFLPFGNNAVVQIVSMKCFCPCGAQLFSNENFFPNDPSKGWTGIQPDGTVYQGGFDYEIKVEYVNGFVKTFTGSACAYQCQDTGFPTENLPACMFSVQHNGNGGIDTALPQPKGCF